jgi:hypothetical protein
MMSNPGDARCSGPWELRVVQLIKLCSISLKRKQEDSGLFSIAPASLVVGVTIQPPPGLAQGSNQSRILQNTSLYFIPSLFSFVCSDILFLSLLRPLFDQG